VKYFIVHL